MDPAHRTTVRPKDARRCRRLVRRELTREAVQGLGSLVYPLQIVDCEVKRLSGGVRLTFRRDIEYLQGDWSTFKVAAGTGLSTAFDSKQFRIERNGGLEVTRTEEMATSRTRGSSLARKRADPAPTTRERRESGSGRKEALSSNVGTVSAAQQFQPSRMDSIPLLCLSPCPSAKAVSPRLP
jgi:hypothetical protein